MGLFIWSTTPSKIFVWDTQISKVFVWDTKVRPSGWQPWADTLLYLPLESDFVDQSWQATTRVFTTNWLSYTTVWWVPSVHIWTTWWAKLTTPYPLQSDITKPLTISLLIYITNTNNRNFLDTAAENYERLSLIMRDWKLKFTTWEFIWYSDTYYANLAHTIPTNQRVYITCTVSTTATKMFVNGQEVESWNGWRYPRSCWGRSRDKTQWIFCTREVSSYASWLNWNARELILEQVEWTAQEVANYYDRIKAKLWI